MCIRDRASVKTLESQLQEQEALADEEELKAQKEHCRKRQEELRSLEKSLFHRQEKNQGIFRQVHAKQHEMELTEKEYVRVKALAETAGGNLNGKDKEMCIRDRHPLLNKFSGEEEQKKLLLLLAQASELAGELQEAEDYFEQLLLCQETYAAVSYTHLDVYKRQPLICGRKNPTNSRISRIWCSG